MNGDPLLANDTLISSFLDEIMLCNRKLKRFTEGLSQEELEWTPPGINNSMSWILVHLATTLWVCHALATGTRTKFNPMAAGLAMAAVRGIDCGTDDHLPAPSTDDPTRYLDEAFKALRTALEQDELDLDTRRVYADRKWRTAWWFLTHELGDLAYHTGQASYLRKLIATLRKRSPRQVI